MYCWFPFLIFDIYVCTIRQGKFLVSVTYLALNPIVFLIENGSWIYSFTILKDQSFPKPAAQCSFYQANRRNSAFVGDYFQRRITPHLVLCCSLFFCQILIKMLIYMLISRLKPQTRAARPARLRRDSTLSGSPARRPLPSQSSLMSPTSPLPSWKRSLSLTWWASSWRRRIRWCGGSIS